MEVEWSALTGKTKFDRAFIFLRKFLLLLRALKFDYVNNISIFIFVIYVNVGLNSG